VHRRTRFEFLDALFDLEIPRHVGDEILIGGNARIGSIVTASVMSIVSSRVMHISFGFPFISAEHDPHLPALQFHRQARSGADSAWI
jgi:hypothetical protein